jgi:hypothetical protein
MPWMTDANYVLNHGAGCQCMSWHESKKPHLSRLIGTHVEFDSGRFGNKKIHPIPKIRLIWSPWSKHASKLTSGFSDNICHARNKIPSTLIDVIFGR